MGCFLRICGCAFLFCLCTAGGSQGRFSQRTYIEAGAGVNAAFFDVGGGSPGLSIQAGALYDLSESWRVGATVGVHRTRGSDEGTGLASRGYAFRSNINEISARGMYIVRFRPYPAREWKTNLEPRIFLNLGIHQFQPVPNDLLSARSNGDFFTVAPFVAGGAGLSRKVSRDLALLIEGACHLSSSDHLEGFADKENSPIPDIFATLLVKFVYKVPRYWN